MLLDAPARPAYRDANVLRWLGAYTTSVTGDLVYFLALSWAVARGAGPAQVGVVMAAGALPRAVLMLAGGVVADRYGPRRVLIGSDLVRCVVILGVAAHTYATGGSVWMLVVVALVFGAVDALFMPAVGALPPRITDPGQLARVQGMRSLSVRVSNAVGPLLAAVVMSVGGSAGAFTVAGVLFTVSLVLLSTMRIRPVPSTVEPTGSTARQELRDGLRYLRGHRRLLPLVIVIGLSEMCFSGPVGAALVLLVDERGWGAGVLGWILSGFSIGGAASALALTALPQVR